MDENKDQTIDYMEVKDDTMNQKQSIFKSLSQINQHNIPTNAASAAFFVFLSLIPIAILICGIITYTPLEEDALISLLKGIIPETIEDFLGGLIREVYEKSASYMSVAVVAVIWSAAKGILAIMTGLNAIEGTKNTKSYFILRLWASLYTLLLIIMIVLLMFVMVFGGLIFDLLISELSKYFQIMSLFSALRFLVVWFLLIFLFVVLYAKVPSVKMKLRYQLPGALFTATIWSVFSFLFSKYIETTGAFSMYGSLTTLVVVLLWLYFSMQFLFYGAELNHYLLPSSSKKYEEKQRLHEERRKLKREIRSLKKS